VGGWSATLTLGLFQGCPSFTRNRAIPQNRTGQPRETRLVGFVCPGIYPFIPTDKW